MQKIILGLSILCLLFSTTNAAENGNPVRRKCGTVMPSAQAEQDFQQKIQQYLSQQNNPQNRITTSYTLPVIVHVVYWNAVENISTTQINSQIDILNADYAGTGLNVNTCPAPFQSLIANTNISFCKAVKNPSGVTLAEPGIERINAQTAGFTNPGTGGWLEGYIDATIKPATTWDATKYLNIWVLPLEDGTLGYATFPGGPSNEDGVVIGYLYYGSTGTVSAPYDKGRTTSHEIGHWLNLYHISGDSECGNDFCADTPKQSGNAADGSGLNYGCPTYPFQVNGCGAGTSPNGELFMNFMDYTDDPCMFMFTNDQRTRMQTAMTTFSLRSSLASSTACNSSSTPTPTASFTVSDTLICIGRSITFTSTSTASSGSLDSIRWTISGGTPATSTATSVTSTFNSAATYTITLKAYKSGNVSTATKTIRVKVKPTVAVTSPTICAGKTAQPIASGATSYTWTGGLSAASNPTTPILTTTTTYTVTGSTSGSGCSNTAVSTVTVTALPNVTVTSPTICAGQTAQPIASGAATYSWTGGLTAVSNPTTPALTTTTTYTVTGTTGSCSKTAVATVTVNTTAPTVTITPNPASVCNGNPITLTGNGANNYTWTSSQTGTTSGGTLTFTPTSTITVNLSGTLTGCSTPGTTSISVTIKPKPTVGVTSPSICTGSTAQPVASGASTYTWTGGLTAVSNPVTPALTSNTTYTVTGTGANGCSSNATSVVTVKPTPGTPSITQSHDTLYSNVIIVGASYEWYKAGILQTTTSTPYYKFSSNGIYTVKVINNGCPSIISGNFNAVLTGIKNNKLNVELSIIPNPNNGLFEIRISSGMNKTYQLKLFNLNGQILFDEEMNVRTGQNSKQINLAGIEKGAYFLSIIGDDDVTTQNIMVQ